MFKYRLITSFILIIFVNIVLFLLSLLEFALCSWIISMISIWEWGKLSGLSNMYQKIFWLFFCGLLLFSIIYSILTIKLLYIVYVLWFMMFVSLFWWIVLLYLIFYYPHSAKIWNTSVLLQLLFGLLIIIPFCISIIFLCSYSYNNDCCCIGKWWLLYIMLLVWGVDSGSYIFGNLFGNHKLILKISPRKTWEGVLGGLLIAGVFGVVFYIFSPIQSTLYILLICSALSILVSILGDLSISMFKREAGVKDSGYIFPGHGGMLDRIDSLTTAIPVFIYLMLLIFEAI